MAYGRIRPTFTPSPRIIKLSEYWDDLQKEIPADDEKQKCLLAGACELGRHFGEFEVIGTFNQNVIALPSLILGVKNITEHLYPITLEGNRFSSCLEAAKHYYKPADGIERDEKISTPEEAIRELTWTLSSNHQYQGDFLHDMVNTMILGGIYGFRSLTADTNIIDAHFQKNVGVTAKEYLIMLFSLWSVSVKDFVFHKDVFLKDSSEKDRLQGAFEAIIDSLSFKLNEPLSSLIFSHAKGYTGKAKSEAILNLRPLIQINENTYFCTGHPYLRIQSSRKFLPKSLFLARNDEGKASTRLGQSIGNRLEHFFKHLCDDWNPSGGHFDEYFYNINNQNLSPDRIAFEKFKSQEIAILFQLKAKTLIEAAMFGGPFDKLKNDIQSAFSEMVYKSITFLKNAHDSIHQGSHNPDTKTISNRTLSAKKLVLIGISPDVPGIFSSKPLRTIIEEKVISEAGKETWDWLHSHYERVYWHIISLHEFQAFLCIPKNNQCFYKTIRAYFNHSRLETDPISPDGFPSSYRSFIIEKYGRKELGVPRIDHHPELKKIFDEFSSESVKYFSLQS